MEKLFVVSRVSHEETGNCEQNVIGVFDSQEKAAKTLDVMFKAECGLNDVTELNEYSYYKEGDSFYIEDDYYGWYVECKITELALNEEKLDY